MKAQQIDNSEKYFPPPLVKTVIPREDEVIKRFYQHVLKTFGHTQQE